MIHALRSAHYGLFLTGWEILVGGGGCALKLYSHLNADRWGGATHLSVKRCHVPVSETLMETRTQQLKIGAVQLQFA